MLQNVYDIRFWIVVWYMYGVVQCVTAQNTPQKEPKLHTVRCHSGSPLERLHIYIYIYPRALD